MLFYFTLFALLFTLGSSSPLAGHLKSLNATYNIQAVLIAGSNEIYNYRHQADICHAYHVLRDHGVPDENIIVMMYDDIANNKENPVPGKIFNKPNGPDVYEGVSKEYTGDEVNVKNFLGVLKGDKNLAAKGKKVLTSGPNDHVFIYFADHGGTGILGMPTPDYLTSKDLNDALVYMHDNKLYGKLTFYVEACEAGSIFENILPDNINIFLTTASKPDESSYGTYCEEPGKLYGICLGDEYSVAWMEDSDAQDLKTETLEQQYQNVVKHTPKSHPQEYGQKSLGSLDVGEFQGEKASNKLRSNPVPVRGSVNSRDVPVHYYLSRISKSNDANEVANLKKQYSNLLAGRRFLKEAMKKLIGDLCESGYCSSVNNVFNNRSSLFDHSSHDKVTKVFHSKCLNIGKNTDVMKYMYLFANLVEEINFNYYSLTSFLETLTESCTKHFANNRFEAIV